MKQYELLTNIGKAKYLVSYHDGVSKHNDGSEFWGLSIFKNKPSLNKFINELIGNGYTEKVFHL
jgi:hypothetical protein